MGADVASAECEQRVHTDAVAPRELERNHGIAPPRRLRGEARRDRAPLRRGLRRIGVAAGEEHLQLVREEPAGGIAIAARARPVANFPFDRRFWQSQNPWPS